MAKNKIRKEKDKVKNLDEYKVKKQPKKLMFKVGHMNQVLDRSKKK